MPSKQPDSSVNSTAPRRSERVRVRNVNDIGNDSDDGMKSVFSLFICILTCIFNHFCEV